MYELQRTKVFSKLKICHNYFEEFQGDFKELVLKAIDLSTQKSHKGQEDKLIQQDKPSTKMPGIRRNSVKVESIQP